MSDWAVLGWGVVIGWFLSWRRKPERTAEMEIGETMTRTLRHLVETARFVGSGMHIEKRWTTDTKLGRFTVTVEREDSPSPMGGEDRPKGERYGL